MACIYAAAVAHRRRCSWATLSAVLLVGALKIHAVQLPALFGMAGHGHESRRGADGADAAPARPLSRTDLDNASIAMSVLSLVMYWLATRKDSVARRRGAAMRMHELASVDWIGTPQSSRSPRTPRSPRPPRCRDPPETPLRAGAPPASAPEAADGDVSPESPGSGSGRGLGSGGVSQAQSKVMRAPPPACHLSICIPTHNSMCDLVLNHRPRRTRSRARTTLPVGRWWCMSAHDFLEARGLRRRESGAPATGI